MNVFNNPVATRLNAVVTGEQGARPMVFAHGFGCDQHMWRLVAPSFEEDHRVVLYDLAGAGRSLPEAYDEQRHGSLDGYADDLVALLRELDLRDVVVVGHSVSAMIAVLAQARAPELVGALVMVGPSARYVDDGDYVGGFSADDITELLELMDSNHFGWQHPLAGMVSGAPDRALAAELETSFCAMDPQIARRFAGVTFRGDNRADLASVTAPTLVLQGTRDTIAPVTAGRFVHEAIASSTMVLIDTTGHCAHLSAPAATVAAIRDFLPSATRG